MKSLHRKSFSLLTLIFGAPTIFVFMVMFIWSSSHQASAASVKLGVYQGVLSVANTLGVLELGYSGQDIATSGDLYFRPGAATEANGARFFRTGNATALDLSGKLCLYNHSTSGPTDCRDVWPSGGGGANNWQIVADASFGSPVNYLEPKDGSNLPTYGVHIGGSAAAQHITGGTAVTVDTFDATNLNSAAQALRLNGNASVGLETLVDGYIRVANQEVFSSGHQGLGSGLDADTLDGQNVTLEGPASCADDGNGYAKILCLCFNIRNGASSTKHCTPMSDRPYDR